MSDEYIHVTDVDELKQRIHKYKSDTKYKFQEFTFEKAGANTNNGTISSLDHTVFLVYYQGVHVETLTIDLISAEKLQQTITDIRNADPSSMNEWVSN